jgi:hypothetical protein
MKISEITKNYLRLIPTLEWLPVNKNTWNTIQDEGLDEEQESYSHTDWVMAKLPISEQDKIKLIEFDTDTIEEFNRFDIALKNMYPGLVDFIDYDKGTVTIVKIR